MKKYETKYPLITSLKYIRDHYYGGSASEMGRSVIPEIDKTTMSRILSGQSKRTSLRLTVGLISLGFSERFLYEGTGDAKGSHAQKTDSGNQILIRPVEYMGTLMTSILSIRECVYNEEGQVTEIRGTFEIIPPIKKVTDPETATNT